MQPEINLGTAGLKTDLTLLIDIDQEDSDGIYLEMPDGTILFDGRRKEV